MTQSVILKNFIQYLEFTREDYVNELKTAQIKSPQKKAQLIKQQEEYEKRIKELIDALKDGYCFGFSVNHAAMGNDSDLEWWENLLVKLATWDKQRASLDQLLTLPGERPVTNLRPGTKPPPPSTYRATFERGLHYVVPMHATDMSAYFPGLNQLNLLCHDRFTIEIPASAALKKPSTTVKSSYFEMVDNNAQPNTPTVKTVKKRVMIAGKLTKEQLMVDLADDFPTNCMVIVCGMANDEGHAIRIYRKGNDWITYDPNYDHSKLETIHKTGTKSECIDEVFRILGTALSIQVAFYDEQATLNFPEHAKRVQTEPEALLKDQGLRMMAKDNPETLTDILKKGFATVDQRKKFMTVLASSLKETEKAGWTALHILGRLAPAALTSILNLIDQSAEGNALADTIIDLLHLQISHGETALSLIAEYAPTAAPVLFQQLSRANKKKFTLALCEALPKKNKSGWTTLHDIANSAPQCLVKLLDLADNSVEGIQLMNVIIKALPEQSDNGFTGLHIIAKTAPIELNLFLREAISKNKLALMTMLTEAIPKKTNDNETTLDRIAAWAPGALCEILNLMDNSPEGVKLAQAIGGTLGAQHGNNLRTLHRIAGSSPIAMPVLLNHMNNLPNRATLLAGYISGFGKLAEKNLTVLRLLILPDDALPALKIVIKSDQGMLLALRVLQVTYVDDAHPLWQMYVPKMKVAVAALFADELLNQTLDMSQLTHSNEETEILSAAYLQIGRKKIYEDGKGWLPNLVLYLTFQLQTSNGLDAVLSDLSAKYANNKTGWQIISETMPAEKKLIMNAIVKHLATMSNAQLIKYGKEIRQAYYSTTAKYRGICKRSNLFNFGTYDKTDLWQTMLSTIQDTLYQKKAGMQFMYNADFTAVMEEPLTMRHL